MTNLAKATKQTSTFSWGYVTGTFTIWKVKQESMTLLLLKLTMNKRMVRTNKGDCLMSSLVAFE